MTQIIVNLYLFAKRRKLSFMAQSVSSEPTIESFQPKGELV